MNKFYYILIIGFTVIIGCSDFFDEDLNEKSVELIAPTDGLETSNTSFTFWWDYVEDASGYNLQIVSPNFETIEKLVLDTNLTDNQFEVQLYPRDFEWRVSAFNGSSSTPYTTYSLSVDSSLDLTGQDIVLLSPNENGATNDSSVRFSWENKPNAEYYTFRIKSGDWATGEDVISPKLVYDNETTENSDELNDGTYSWAVQANNSTSSTLFNSRTFIIDRIAPETPDLISPVQDTETSTNVTFSWKRPNESGSKITDSLYVSTDPTFVAIHKFAIERTETTYQHTFDLGSESSEDYFWRVCSIDKAGNKSEYSTVGSFTVKNEK